MQMPNCAIFEICGNINFLNPTRIYFFDYKKRIANLIVDILILNLINICLDFEFFFKQMRKIIFLNNDKMF